MQEPNDKCTAQNLATLEEQGSSEEMSFHRWSASHIAFLTCAAQSFSVALRPWQNKTPSSGGRGWAE